MYEVEQVGDRISIRYSCRIELTIFTARSPDPVLLTDRQIHHPLEFTFSVLDWNLPGAKRRAPCDTGGPSVKMVKHPSEKQHVVSQAR